MTYAPWNHRILSTYPRISYSIIDTEEFEKAIELAIEELAARNPRMTYRFAGDDVILTHTPTAGRPPRSRCACRPWS